MIVLTSIKDIILCICNDAEKEENGYYYVKELDIFFTEENIHKYEITDIPAEVRSGLYCYNPDDGFYRNNEYVLSNDEELEVIKRKQNSLLSITQMIYSVLSQSGQIDESTKADYEAILSKEDW